MVSLISRTPLGRILTQNVRPTPSTSDVSKRPPTPSFLTPKKKTPTTYVVGGKTYVSGGGGGGGGGGGTSQPTSSGMTTEEFIEKVAPKEAAEAKKTSKILNLPSVTPTVQQQARGKSFVSAGPSGVPTREEEKTTETGFGTAVVTSGKNILKVGTIGKEGFGEYFSNIFSPFSEAGRFSEGKLQVAKEFAPFVSGKGTQISAEYIPFGKFTTTEGLSTGEIILLERQKSGEIGPTLTMTPTAAAVFESERVSKAYEKKAQEDFIGGSSQLASVYQERIDTGQMTYEQAVKDYELTSGMLVKATETKYGGLAQKEFETTIADFSRKRGISESSVKAATSGFDISESLRMGVTAGALTLASVTPVGLTIVSAGFAGKGIADITGGILQRDITLGAMGVAEMGFGAFGARQVFGTQRELLKAFGKEVSVPSNMLERQWRKELFKDIEMQKPFLKSKGAPEMFEDYTAVKLTGGRGGAKMGIQEQINLNIKAFPLSESEFTIAGTGTRRISYRTLSGEKIKLPTEKFGVGSVYPVRTVSKPGTFLFPSGTITLEEGIVGAYGEAFVKPLGGDIFKTQKFVSVSQETPEGFKIVSGKQTRGFFQKQRSFDVEIKGFLPTGKKPLVMAEIRKNIWLKPITLRGNLESRIFIEKPLAEDSGRMFKQIIQRGGRGEMPTDLFTRLDTSVRGERLLQILKLEPKNILAKELTASFGVDFSATSMLKPISKSVSSAFKPPITPSMYAGKGLYERTDMVSAISPEYGGAKSTGQITVLDIKPTRLQDSYKGLITGFEGLNFDILGKQKPRLKPVSGSAMGSAMGLGSGQGQISIQTQPSLERLRTEQILKPLTTQITPPPLTPFEFAFEPITPRTIIPFGPFFPGFDIGEGYVRRRKGKRKFQRRPSMVAAEFNIRSLKPVKGEYSGLFARPIV